VATRRALCAQESRDRGEPLSATASRVDHWLLVEYHGAWQRDALSASHLPADVKRHLAEQAALLPHTKLLFIRRRSRRAERRVHVFVASSTELDPWLVELVLEQPLDLLRLDVARGHSVGTAVEEPLLLVCTHGKRDRCCAAFGRALYDDLRAQPEGDRVWQSTHVGGDRFAGNLVCLPYGLYFGRVGTAEVRPLLERLGAGEILLDAYRGRSSYNFPVQAAEHELRRRRGILGIDDLRLESSERTAAGWRVSFRHRGGDLHTVDVERREGEPAYLTCSATTVRRPPRYLVR
jgi:hypothetical protein